MTTTKDGENSPWGEGNEKGAGREGGGWGEEEEAEARCGRYGLLNQEDQCLFFRKVAASALSASRASPGGQGETTQCLYNAVDRWWLSTLGLHVRTWAVQVQT